MDQLKKIMDSVTKMSDEDWLFFQERFEKVSYRKKEIIINEGDVERYLYFINFGIMRFYVETERHEKPFEITFSFMFPDSFASAYDSFVMMMPCSYYVESMTDCELLRISYSNLQEVYQHTQFGEYVGRLAAENLYLRKSGRELSLLTQTAEARYLNLVKNYPHYIQEIPLKYLASFIGVTPQALSRIRARIS